MRTLFGLADIITSHAIMNVHKPYYLPHEEMCNYVVLKIANCLATT